MFLWPGFIQSTPTSLWSCRQGLRNERAAVQRPGAIFNQLLWQLTSAFSRHILIPSTLIQPWASSSRTKKVILMMESKVSLL